VKIGYHPRCGGGAGGDEEAAMRHLGQMPAALLPNVGYATNADHCDPCDTGLRTGLAPALWG
jgi:hypothetical protein